MSAPPSPSPVTKMSHSQRTASHDSADGIRKRVCKACDRCRLKKSKCDGSNPCSRCKADNAICVFGERKRSHDKVYPRGYVEMLEQQQSQLVAGLQEMYRRLISARAWEGDVLRESNGHPLTHDILAAMSLLEAKHDGSGEHVPFEDDFQKLQSRLIADGNGFVRRRGSFSSDSDHSQRGNVLSASTATPVLSKPAMFRDSFNFGSNPASPIIQSPAPPSRQERLPVQTSSFQSDPQLYSPEWAQVLSDATNAQHAKFALQQQQQQQHQQQHQSQEMDQDVNGLDAFLSGNIWAANLSIDAVFNNVTSFPQYSSMQSANDLGAFDSVDVDFSKYVDANPPAPREVYM